MKAIRFLEITAKRLKDERHEADSRTSAGRSYYAIYHEIKNALETEGDFLIPSDHGLLPLCFFFSEATNEIKQIGMDLQTLYSYRYRADYKLDDRIKKADAKTAYKLACSVYKNFSNIFKGQTKALVLIAAKATIKTKKGMLN